MGAWGIGFGILAVVALQDSVPPEDLLMDRTTAGRQPWYFGFVTALGILAWTVTVCSCAFTTWTAHFSRRLAARNAFAAAACLFAFLLFDDLFRLHSDVFPSLFSVSKHAVMATYLFGTAAWTLVSWRELQRTRFELLIAALVGLGGSLLYDMFYSGADTGTRVLIEDGLKFLGLVALATWATATAADISRAAIVARQTADSDADELVAATQ